MIRGGNIAIGGALFLSLASACGPSDRPPPSQGNFSKADAAPAPADTSSVDASGEADEDAQTGEPADGGGAPSSEASAPDAASDGAPASDGAAPDAGARLDGGPDVLSTDASPGEASSDAVAEAAAPPPGPRCDPTHVWTGGARVSSVPQTNFGRFGGIGIDELSIAWTSTNGAIFVADRATRAGAFGVATQVPAGSTILAIDRVGFAPTGVTVVAVVADRSAFVEFDRAGVGAPWEAASSLALAGVNAMASVDGGGTFSEPVMGADGNSFYYLLALGTSAPILFESRWDTQQHAWAAGVAMTDAAFTSASSTQRRRATGASSDGLTLFFFDEVAPSQERAAWRDSVGATFGSVTAMGPFAEAAPNYRCDTLYYQSTDTGGAGVFLAQ